MDGLPNTTGLEQCLYCLKVFGSVDSLAQHKHQMHDLHDEEEEEEEDVEAVVKTEVLSDGDDDGDDHGDYVGDDDEPCKEEVLIHETDVKTELKREDEVSTAYHDVKAEIPSDDADEDYKSSFTPVDFPSFALKTENSSTQFSSNHVMLFVERMQDNKRTLNKEEPAQLHDSKETSLHSSPMSFGQSETSLSEQDAKKPNTCILSPNQCRFCEQNFTSNSCLKTHMRVHTGEKPFECSVCRNTFSQRGHLQSHMRTHTGEKPYECSLCKKTFSQSCHLRRHMRTHTGERPYECIVCKIMFSHSGTLKQHMRVHTGEKPYECSVCKKTFTRSDTLKKHIRVHSEKNPI